MGLNFRKSINLGWGFKLNLGKKSVGISAGVKGMRVSANTKRGVTATASIPGTGISYSKSLNPKSKKTTKKKSANDKTYSKSTLLVLSVLFGWFGFHRFYVGKIGTGVLYLFTLGGFLIGNIIDILAIISGKFTDSDGAVI